MDNGSISDSAVEDNRTRPVRVERPTYECTHSTIRIGTLSRFLDEPAQRRQREQTCMIGSISLDLSTECMWNASAKRNQRKTDRPFMKLECASSMRASQWVACELTLGLAVCEDVSFNDDVHLRGRARTVLVRARR